LADDGRRRQAQALGRCKRIGDERSRRHVGRPPLASSVPTLVETDNPMRL